MVIYLQDVDDNKNKLTNRNLGDVEVILAPRFICLIN
nr:MAG TPA: hypothetical protein [Crassvirales sp.]